MVLALTYLDSPMAEFFLEIIYFFRFLPSLEGKMRSKLDQKFKFWVSPVSVKK